ncbi:MAG: hypothetical protein ACTSQG_12315, partial [Promethearchaeota archaeon]
VDNKLTIAATNPYDLSFKDEIKFITDYNIEIVLSPESSVLQAINYIFGVREKDWIPRNTPLSQGESKARLSAAKVLERILKHALSIRAKEVQLQKIEDVFQVMYLKPNSTIMTDMFPSFYYDTIGLRIKNLANLNLESNRFQEGLFSYPINEKRFSFRVLIFPNPQGENIIIKLP